MANAYRDQNNVPTMTASSNSDGFTPVRLWADPVTHRLLVDNNATSTISSGSGAPGTTPTGVGYTYVDTLNANIYMATGTSSSADWKLLAII